MNWRINRRHFMAGVGGAAVLALTSQAALSADAVKVGVVLPLTGISATIGNQTMNGAKAAAEQINEKGGVASLGGAKLELIFADSQSKPDIGASEVERLIQREGVATVLGAYNSGVTFPASEVAERYKTPWIVTGAVKMKLQSVTSSMFSALLTKQLTMRVSSLMPLKCSLRNLVPDQRQSVCFMKVLIGAAAMLRM